MLREKLTGRVIDETNGPDCLAIAFPELYERSDKAAETRTAVDTDRLAEIEARSAATEDRLVKQGFFGR